MPSEAGSSASPSSKGWQERSAGGRWGAAALLLAALIVATTVSHLTPHWRVCDDVVVRVGTLPTVRSCRPLAITDTPVVLGLIFIIGLIAPDFRRISVAGVLELEREVHDQERRLEALAAKIDVLTINATSARASVTFAQPLPPGVLISVSDETLAEKARRLEDLDKSSEDQ